MEHRISHTGSPCTWSIFVRYSMHISETMPHWNWHTCIEWACWRVFSLNTNALPFIFLMWVSVSVVEDSSKSPITGMNILLFSYYPYTALYVGAGSCYIFWYCFTDFVFHDKKIKKRVQVLEYFVNNNHCCHKEVDKSSTCATSTTGRGTVGFYWYQVRVQSCLL
jgi:hypothetical protein